MRAAPPAGPRWATLVPGLVAVAAVALVLAGVATAQDAKQACMLSHEGSQSASSEQCIACHRGGGSAASMTHGHPLDLDYRAASSGKAEGLRPYDEAVRRGVFLPDGEIRCVTCHDRSSRFPFHLALPPGAKVSTDDPRDATPLCLRCHTFD